MRNLIILLAIAFVSIIICSCEYDNPVKQISIKDLKWWILVHPNSKVGDPGIYLYNESKDEVELKLNIPANLTSPHALDYDGEYLWIGGANREASIYKLDPITGAVLFELNGIRTEGIAADNGILYYSSVSLRPIDINIIKTDGTKLKSISTSAGVINDIDIKGGYIYYAINDDTDKIVQVNLISEEEKIIIHTGITHFYTLTIIDNFFIAVNRDYSNGKNSIRRIHMKTGRTVSENEICMKGWITAIAPFIQK